MMDSPEKGGSVIRENPDWKIGDGPVAIARVQRDENPVSILSNQEKHNSELYTKTTQGPKIRQGQEKFPGIPEWPSRPLRNSCIARGGNFMAFISHTE